MKVFAYICLGSAIALGVAGNLIWAIWIRRYLRLHGEHPGTVFFNLTPLLDYRKAKRIARQQGYDPWFLLWTKRIEIVVLLLLVAFIVAALLYSQR